jgi:GNAT superfamily N-acetyltransferase
MLRLRIRDATAADAPLILSMIRELAEFERELDQVDVTVEDLVREGFAPNPNFHALIAEWEGQPVGYAVYFFTFSTWIGRQSLFIEDVFVREPFRQRGIGRHLFRHMARIARDRRCYGMRWEVLNWNTPAIEFYRSLGAILQTNWFHVLLHEKAFAEFAEQDFAKHQK